MQRLTGYKMQTKQTTIDPPDYDLVEVWQTNIKNAQQAWNTGWMKDKITNHLLRTEGVADPARILAIAQKIRQDPDMASHYCKNPGRQSSHQSIFAAWLHGLPKSLVQGAKALPSRGPGSLYVSQGKVVSYATHHERPEGANAKSIDFVWTSGGYTIYATHKFTGQEGGAQDNQYHDIQRFLQEARHNTQQHERFIAVCDGPYYQGTAPENRQLSRIAYLQATCSRNTMALPSSALVGWLQSLPKT